MAVCGAWCGSVRCSVPVATGLAGPAGLPGPHLVVTPIAVLRNWANELKRFTPRLAFVKVHGGQSVWFGVQL